MCVHISLTQNYRVFAHAILEIHFVPVFRKGMIFVLINSEIALTIK